MIKKEYTLILTQQDRKLLESISRKKTNPIFMIPIKNSKSDDKIKLSYHKKVVYVKLKYLILLSTMYSTYISMIYICKKK